MEGYEQSLSFIIKEEKAYARRSAQGDLGVKVQTSGTSDPTAKAAIENIMIMEAIQKGDLESVTSELDINKYDLRDSTRSNYLYTYNKFVRDTFGKKRLVDVKFSDVLQFYHHLINVDGLALGTDPNYLIPGGEERDR